MHDCASSPIVVACKSITMLLFLPCLLTSSLLQVLVKMLTQVFVDMHWKITNGILCAEQTSVTKLATNAEHRPTDLATPKLRKIRTITINLDWKFYLENKNLNATYKHLLPSHSQLCSQTFSRFELPYSYDGTTTIVVAHPLNISSLLPTRLLLQCALSQKRQKGPPICRSFLTFPRESAL